MRFFLAVYIILNIHQAMERKEIQALMAYMQRIFWLEKNLRLGKTKF